MEGSRSGFVTARPAAVLTIAFVIAACSSSATPNPTAPPTQAEVA